MTNIKTISEAYMKMKSVESTENLNEASDQYESNLKKFDKLVNDVLKARDEYARLAYDAMEMRDFIYKSVKGDWETHGKFTNGVSYRIVNDTFINGLPKSESDYENRNQVLKKVSSLARAMKGE